MLPQDFLPPELHLVGEFGGLVIATQVDLAVTPGKQNILISTRDHAVGAPVLLAHDLAVVLGAEPGAVYNHTVEIARTPWLVIPHTAVIDARLKALVNLAATLRYAAPGLIQLTLDLAGLDLWTPSR